MSKRTLKLEDLAIETFETGRRPEMRAASPTVLTTCSPTCDPRERECIGGGTAAV